MAFILRWSILSLYISLSRLIANLSSEPKVVSFSSTTSSLPPFLAALTSFFEAFPPVTSSGS